MADQPQPPPSARQLALFDEHSAAVQPYIADRSVAIICQSAGTPKDLGSGTLVQIGDKTFIATAGHVIEGYALPDLVILPFKGKDRHRFAPLSMGACQGSDVAWIEVIPARALDSPPWQAATLNSIQCGVDHIWDVVAFHGFPRELLRLSSGTVRPHLLAQLYFAGGTVATADWPNNIDPPLDPRKDLVVDYTLTGRVPGDPLGRTVPDPYGVSGAGIWSFGSHVPGLWSPACARLIGIDRSWVSGKRLLFATQMQYWLDCLANSYPDLQALIDALPRTP